jgi:hypothetical protein
MSWKCPTCGRRNFETFKNCICGQYVDESVLIEHNLMEGHDASREGEQFQVMTPEGTGNHMVSPQRALESHKAKAPGRPESKSDISFEEVIREIDSWLFTFSHLDNCISIGTPALQSFRLKLTLKDLEDLLEFLYHKTGKEKTTRKIRLSTKEITEVIDKVDGMIEEKRSKAALQFTGDELQEITDLINVKLKV